MSSLYGPCNFKLIMGDYPQQDDKNSKQNEKKDIRKVKTKNAFNPSNLLIFKDILGSNLPIISTSEDLHKYIYEIMMNQDKMDLNEKYICSICLAMNRNIMTKEIIEDILDEKFHLTLMNWLTSEKRIIEEKNENSNPYQFNIFIGLLINIISLYEIFPIKTSELCKFKFYEKLFKLYKLIKLNIKNSFPFLISLKNLLKKWKTQINYLQLSETIQNFTLLGKKKKSHNGKEINIINKRVKKEEKETDADSDEKESNKRFIKA